MTILLLLQTLWGPGERTCEPHLVRGALGSPHPTTCLPAFVLLITKKERKATGRSSVRTEVGGAACPHPPAPARAAGGLANGEVSAQGPVSSPTVLTRVHDQVEVLEPG